jgi:HTH-type transcriptional regulator/antitoxin HigA
MKLKVINSERAYRQALKDIERLWDARPGSPSHDALAVLAVLVEDYEKRLFPMDDPDPVAAILFRLEQAGLEPKDLVPILGSRSRVSEILNHKRSLTVEMVRRLSSELGIPMEALIPLGRKRQPRGTGPARRRAGEASIAVTM